MALQVALIAVLGIGLVSILPVLADPGPAIGERQMRRVLRQAFPVQPPDWQARLLPDPTMATCAKWRNSPPKEVVEAIKARERAQIRYPEDGRLLGDWRRGEEIAQSGYGLRFTDSGGRENGGNCYACHQLSPGEVSFGTLGTSLKGYGRIHGLQPEAVRAVYEKIYNSQSATACSPMPRFGANGILTIEQIKDLVALLMDPESPVNREPGPEAAGNPGPQPGRTSRP